MNAIKKVHNALQRVVPLDKRNKNIAFFFVVVGTALDNINISGAITTYFSVYEKFNASTTTVSWTLSAYSLTIGSFILLAGKVTDVIGAHIVFQISIALTSLFALICAVIEKQIIVLIVFRALQGVSAAFLIPSAFAIAGNYYKGGKPLMIAVACLMLSITATFGFGLLLGGIFSVTSLGYKSFYYFTFAVGTVVTVGSYLTMIPITRTAGHKAMRMKDLDYYGSFGFVSGCLLVILAFTQSGETWNDPSVYVPLPVGVVIILVSLWFELIYVQGYKDKVDSKIAQDTEASGATSTEVPEKNNWRYKLQLLFPRESLKVPNFPAYLVITPLSFIASIAVNTTEVQYFLYVIGNTPLIAGLKIFPAAIGVVVGTVTNREPLIYKIGLKWVLMGAQLAQLGFSVWISRHDYTKAHNYWVYEFVPLFFFGWMWSVYLGVYVSGTMRHSPGHLQGVTAGLLQTVGLVANSLGNSIVTSILGELYVAITPEMKDALSKKFDHVYYFIFAVLALCSLCMFAIDNQRGEVIDPMAALNAFAQAEDGEELKTEQTEKPDTEDVDTYDAEVGDSDEAGVKERA